MNPYDPDTSYDEYSQLYHSERNSNLIFKILEKEDNLISRTWTYLERPLTETYSLQLVDQDSSEFLNVQELWSKSIRGYKIIKLERLENPFLLAQFLIKKEQKLKKYRSVSEENLFHGTHERFIDSICRFNFDWRLKGKSRGYKFGQGVSFSPDAFYASHYTDKSLIFLVAVLVHRKCIGCDSTILPPPGYDTTMNSPNTVLVKFEDAEFYPRYLIHFQYISI